MSIAGEIVLYEVDGAVGIVTLNRPEKLNAISAALREGLVETLRRADRDPAVSVIVLRAEGRSFCTGFDLGPGGVQKDEWRHDALRWHAYLATCLDFEMTPWRLGKPVIASVQGHALGGACELVMFCDLTIAAENAVFGEPETRLSSAGPAMIMPWIIGMKKARELIYFGDSIDARTALSLGMVNRVVPTAELRPATLAYAKRLALISPEALVATKRAINRGADAAGFTSAINAGLDVLAPLYAARTEIRAQMQEIAREKGFGAALKWRHAQFAV
jgi:enoyl-CoA hydratase/carnithine racemase